jgi:hypothetical protein
METILIRIYLIEARFFRKACHREAGMVPILSDLAPRLGCGRISLPRHPPSIHL